MSSEESANAGQKSKQDRIRDNQRRSRARRQEYLADLERRLNECHVTCREAELARAAFADLQAENARLRSLLSSAGINPDPAGIQAQHHNPQQSVDNAGATSLRQIKPRFRIPEAPSSPPAPGCQAPSPSCRPPASVPSENFQVFQDQFNNQLVAVTTALEPTVASTAPVAPNAWYAWHYPSDRDTANASHGSIFICDTFHVPPNGFLLADDGNTIQCSVAKDMIDQYNPTPEEMQEIVSRLATAFTQPAYPGGNCRVSNHVLFQILSEISARQMQP